ncbi:MAG: 3-hydroxyacyl-CoA dehydrogenase [Planctomycetaceae bacterium]
MAVKTQNITILGTGVLGAQIAFHTAFKGKQVVSYNPDAKELEKGRANHQQLIQTYKNEVGASDADLAATSGRLTYTTDLKQAVANADIVIEVVPEVPEIKEATYLELAPLLPEQTVLLSNSSTLLPSDFAPSTGRPAKFAALHFANMIWKLNVVEIMGHAETADETYETAATFAIEIGMIPIAVGKENPGYVLNYWLDQMLNDAQTMVTNGIASPEDVDRTYLIVNQGAQYGPFGIIDIIGMMTMRNIWKYWGEKIGDQQMVANAQYLEDHFIATGKTGVLQGEGYYTYPTPAFSAPDFLSTPSLSAVPDIVKRCKGGN